MFVCGQVGATKVHLETSGALLLGDMASSHMYTSGSSNLTSSYAQSNPPVECVSTHIPSARPRYDGRASGNNGGQLTGTEHDKEAYRQPSASSSAGRKQYLQHQLISIRQASMVCSGFASYSL